MIFLLIFLGFTSSMNPVRGYIGSYEKRTDPLDPFVFTLDMLYYSSSSIELNGRENLYNQVFLFADSVYTIFINSGFLYDSSNPIIHFCYELYDGVNYKESFSVYPTLGKEVILFIPEFTGYYNLTLRVGVDGFTSWADIQIGILDVPTITLGVEFKCNDYWDFYSDAITIGIIDLDSGYYTVKAMDDLIPHYWPSVPLYNIPFYAIWGIGGNYKSIANLSDSYLIDPAIESKTWMSGGEYVLCSPDPSFGFSEYTSSSTDPDGIPPFLIFVFIAGPIGLLLAIGIPLYYKRQKKKRLLEN